jgi:hypothetical protein
MVAGRHRSTYFGPHRAIRVGYPDHVVHVTLYDLEPGEFWNPAFEAELLTTRILTPNLAASEALFRFRSTNFTWLFRIGPVRNNLLVGNITTFSKRAFTLFWHFGIHTFAYNSDTDPAGKWAINGSATMSWQEV